MSDEHSQHSSASASSTTLLDVDLNSLQSMKELFVTDRRKHGRRRRHIESGQGGGQGPDLDGLAIVVAGMEAEVRQVETERKVDSRLVSVPIRFAAKTPEQVEHDGQSPPVQSPPAQTLRNIQETLIHGSSNIAEPLEQREFHRMLVSGIRW